MRLLQVPRARGLLRLTYHILEICMEDTGNVDVYEIEVTPEMMEAGVDRLLEFNIENSDAYRAVREILRLVLPASVPVRFS